MMTAMIKSPGSNSDSDDSDTPPPSYYGSTIDPSLKHFEVNKYQPNNRSKNLEPKNTMQRSSPKQSSSVGLYPPYSFISTPQLTDSNSPRPPNYNSHKKRPNNLFLRHSQLTSLTSPPSIHHSFLMKTLILTTPPIIFPQTMYGNHPKLILLLRHL